MLKLNLFKTAGVFFLLIINISIFAQNHNTDTLFAGSSQISGSSMKPYTNNWKVTLTTPKGDKRFFQVWTDYSQKMDLNGKTFIHRIQDIYDANGNFLRSQMNFVDEKTLLPVRGSLTFNNGTNYYFEFNGKHVTGNYKIKTDTSQEIKYDTTFSRTVYDWTLYGILLAGLPLKVDFHTVMPIYEYPNPTDGWLKVDVNKKEMIDARNRGKISAFKVETNQNMIFYIIKEPPYVLKLIYTTPKGAILTWDMMNE
jgi:hypothetical protein